MTEYLLLGAMAAVVLLQLIVRTNTAIVFLALCAGSVLLATTGANLSLVASSLSSGIEVSTNIVRLLLLLVPPSVCLFILSGHLSKGLLPLGFIPALMTSLLSTIFIIPLLSRDLQREVGDTDTWSILMQYQEPIVVLGLVASILLITITVRNPNSGKHHKKNKH